MTRRRHRALAAVVLGGFFAALLLGPGQPAQASPAAPPDASDSARRSDAATPPTPDPRWLLPLPEGRVTKRFEQPAHTYAPGHRGIDITGVGSEVRAPADGVVVFAGVVVDRPVMTIDHGNDLVSSIEPVETSLTVGTPVVAGQLLGTVGDGGHVGPGSAHFGVRFAGEYVDPMLFLPLPERAVLLPCC